MSIDKALDKYAGQLTSHQIGRMIKKPASSVRNRAVELGISLQLTEPQRKDSSQAMDRFLGRAV